MKLKKGNKIKETHLEGLAAAYFALNKIKQMSKGKTNQPPTIFWRGALTGRRIRKCWDIPLSVVFCSKTP